MSCIPVHCSCICWCRRVAPHASVSHVECRLPEYLARGAACRLNKGSHSQALKRTFIKHFHGLHLFLPAMTDKLRRPRCYISLCAPSADPRGSAHILLLMFLVLAPHDDHHHFWVNKANLPNLANLPASRRGRRIPNSFTAVGPSSTSLEEAQAQPEVWSSCWLWQQTWMPPRSASLNCGTEAQLNFKLIWQLCSNHDEGLLVMHEDPEASPWCSKSGSPSVLRGCITLNCLTPSRHGHSVGLGLV